MNILRLKIALAGAGFLSLLMAGTILFPVHAHADETTDLTLSPDACRQLMVAHQPGVDGSAEYQAGVDVTGKPVVEADLGGSSIPVNDVIEFQLSVDMAQYLGLIAGPKPEGYIPLGTISVLPDGRVLRDGQPMETQAETALRALCQTKKMP